MRNFEEKMIRRARNTQKKRTLPARWIHTLGYHFDRGGFIPLFQNDADNIAIEADNAQRRLARTDRSKYNRKKSTQP